ncbi:MAG: YHS domain-containing (seleno)protein [Burkholderiaceae bacterium]|jgi:YHS domain-containing protein
MTKTTLRANLLAIGIAVAATFSAALVPTTSYAYDENSASAVNVDTKGIGLRGYDPVAYFTVGAPTLGNGAFTAKHNGVTFQFASAANHAAFQADPAKYAPQFGGFCAMGVALEKKLDGDPDAWHIADGKLYLNVNKDVQKKWLQDVSGNNKKAEQIWPSIRNKTPKSLA